MATTMTQPALIVGALLLALLSTSMVAPDVPILSEVGGVEQVEAAEVRAGVLRGQIDVLLGSRTRRVASSFWAGVVECWGISAAARASRLAARPTPRRRA